jgi:hypothetical protein
MAIQFQCPYCTATVRVPDSAAGKSGNCPKCETKIRIPELGQPAAPGPQPAVSSPPPGQRPAAAPVARKPAEEEGGAESFFAAAAPKPARRIEPQPTAFAPAEPFAPGPMGNNDGPAFFEQPVAHVDRMSLDQLDDEPDEEDSGRAIAQLRKKQPIPFWMYMLPVVGIAIVGGAVFGYLKLTEPKFIGDVTGERIELKKPITVTVPWQESGASEDEQKAIRSLLDKKNIPLASNLSVVEFSTDVRGVVIEAKSGSDTDIVKVDPMTVPIVATWLSRNGERLQVSRSTTIGPAARDFTAKVADAITHQKPIQGMAEYRDRLAMPALNRSLGHWVQAIADNKIYPCIYEDPQGQLYFAVPASARYFEVREKGDVPGAMLPRTFLLRVSVPPRVVKTAPDPEPEKKPEEPTEPTPETETEPEEMKAMPADEAK